MSAHRPPSRRRTGGNLQHQRRRKVAHGHDQEGRRQISVGLHQITSQDRLLGRSLRPSAGQAQQ